MKCSNKVIWENIDCANDQYNRPTFKLFFELINGYCTSQTDISIISNSDIYFDETLELIINLNLKNICIALTRHEVYTENKSPLKLGWGPQSQDTWIIQGKVLPLGVSDWPMGISGCDNRICWELEHAGYKVINPCLSIIANHLHHNNDVANRGNSLSGNIQVVAVSRIEDCGLSKLW
ncbi:MAG: hypothetical protein M0R50_03195 [Candidatus Cloacimonetes bacterium]|jgi:hypothetical protein|nr:hypothetical protein [Candidatus Cloacimonadota bacterium]